MSAKKKPRPAARRSTATAVLLREPVDYLISKGRYKEAVKQAKLCYKVEATPEHHRLLESATYLRAQQLLQGAMTNAAREVAEHLLALGITDPKLVEPAAALMLAVGLSGRALELQGRIEEPEARTRLTRRAADHAVVHPDQVPASQAEVRAGALQVRSALSALETGTEEEALALLRDVSRNSLFSDWKLFVRGLAALRRGDPAEARANWERLDPERAASRLARTLTSLDQPGTGTDALERWAFGDVILAPLRNLASLVAENRWQEAALAVGPLRITLHRVDPVLAQRLTRVLYIPLLNAASSLHYREAQSLLKTFTKAAEPLPIDPRWNRLWAMAWEGPQGGFDEAEPFWKRYIDDLATAPGIVPELRPRAQALVWSHLGKQLVEVADALGPGPSPFPKATRAPRRVDREVAEARRRAVECLEMAERLGPAHRPAHQALIDAHKAWGEPEKAASAARRLLDALPDDLETLLYLHEFHIRRDEPEQALGYTLRARAIKPLDEKILGHEWSCHMALARQHAIQGRFEEGRAELAAAEGLSPTFSEAIQFTTRKVIFALKAGEADRVSDLVAETQDHQKEPAPLWLTFWIESIRYKLPEAEQTRFQSRWFSSLSKKVRGDTAAALSDVMAPFVSSTLTYPGCDEHLHQVLEYLKRTTRIKYGRDDLSRVCAFLGLLANAERTAKPLESSARTLLDKLAKRGTKLHADAYEFYYMLASLEMSQLPFKGDIKQARSNLEIALSLAQKAEASDPRASEFLPMVQQALSTLNDLFSRPMGFPFGEMPFSGRPGGGGFPSMADVMEAMAGQFGLDLDDMLDGDDDDDDVFESPFDPFPARPRRAAKKARKKKR